jgi:hypothetical protein
MAIDCLYDAIGKLDDVERELSSQAISIVDLVDKLADSWLAVNRCRVFTEASVDLEELLIPAMGLIFDAKSMLESCISWKIGLTDPAYRSIFSAVRLAKIEGLRPALEMLEGWLCAPAG